MSIEIVALFYHFFRVLTVSLLPTPLTFRVHNSLFNRIKFVHHRVWGRTHLQHSCPKLLAFCQCYLVTPMLKSHPYQQFFTFQRCFLYKRWWIQERRGCLGWWTWIWMLQARPTRKWLYQGENEKWVIQKKSVVVPELGNFTASLLHMPDSQASYYASERVAVYVACYGTWVHQSPPATEAKAR